MYESKMTVLLFLRTTVKKKIDFRLHLCQFGLLQLLFLDYAIETTQSKEKLIIIPDMFVEKPSAR